MQRFITFMLSLLLGTFIAFGQEKKPSKWVIQGGLADWEVFLQNRNYFDVRTNLSFSRILGNRFLLGGGLISDFQGTWPTDTRPDGGTFSWNPSWLGLTGKAYLNKVPRLEKILNPYIELGIGGVAWSSLRVNRVLMQLERSHQIGLDWFAGVGASLWMIPELSLDIQANYIPYSSKETTQYRDHRPHQLVLGISMSYWFSKEKKAENQ